MAEEFKWSRNPIKLLGNIIKFMQSFTGREKPSAPSKDTEVNNEHDNTQKIEESKNEEQKVGSVFGELNSLPTESSKGYTDMMKSRIRRPKNRGAPSRTSNVQEQNAGSESLKLGPIQKEPIGQKESINVSNFNQRFKNMPNTQNTSSGTNAKSNVVELERSQSEPNLSDSKLEQTFAAKKLLVQQALAKGNNVQQKRPQPERTGVVNALKNKIAERSSSASEVNSTKTQQSDIIQTDVQRVAPLPPPPAPTQQQLDKAYNDATMKESKQVSGWTP